MATPEQEKLQQLRELRKEFAQYRKEFEALSGKKMPDPFAKMNLDQIVKSFNNVDDAISHISSQIRNVNRDINALDNNFANIKSIVADISKELDYQDSTLKKSRQSFSKIRGIVSEMEYLNESISSYTTSDVKKLQEKNKRAFQGLKLKKDELALEIQQQRGNLTDAQIRAGFGGKELKQKMELLEFTNDQMAIEERINSNLEKRGKEIGRVNKAMGLTGAIVGGIGGALSKLGFGDLAEGINEAKDAMKSKAEEVTKMGKKAAGLGGQFRVMFTGLSSLAGSIAEKLTDPLVIMGLFAKAIKGVVKLFTHLEHSVTNVGKTLGLSRDSAHEMTMAMKSAAAASGDTFLNMDRMVDAQLRISNALGTNIRLTDEQLGNQARLAEFVGLQEEELANVYTASLLTGQSQEQLYNTVVATNDSIFASNALFKEAAGITGQLAINLGNNPATISKAVAEAKRLGINLETARDMAMGTLDFENSIQAEMEAMVLTGKNINLNRARELAFAGDFKGAAAEMLDQVGGIAEFQSMNVMAQQSLAEAMGLSVDQLADAVRERERNNKLAQRQAELEADGLSAQEASLKALRENQTVSERLSNAAAKIGDFFGSYIAPAVEFVADNLERGMALFGGLFGNANKTKEELEAMGEPLATATQKGEELKSKFSGVIDTIKSIGAGIKSAFGKLSEIPGFKLLAGLAGGALVLKGAKNLFQGKGLFGQKLGASASNPLFVTMAGGSFASDIGSSISKTFKGKIFKGLSTVLGGKKTMAGRAMRGMAAKSMAGGLAKTAMKGGSKAATKGIGKVAGKSLAKAAGKSLLKKIPIVGALAGIGFGISRAMKGDFLGAAMEVGSGLASTIPGVGTAASVGLDAALAARDVYQGTSRGVDPEPQTGEAKVADFVIKSLPEDSLVMAGGTQFGKETNDLLRQLIAAVNSGGDVMIDGVKVGNTLSVASYKL